MKTIKGIALIFGVAFIMAACNSNNSDNMGSSTPIDSTNVNGTAPATYGGNNPANDERADSNRNNVNDTGTRANNVHNTPQ